MCLTIYSRFENEAPQPKIAKRNIICYKTLECNLSDKRIYSQEDITFETPFQGFRVQLGKRYVEEFDIDSVFRVRSEDMDDMDCPYAFGVEEGMFHSYGKLEDAVIDCADYGDGNCVFYAIIPKGALYYEGDYCGDFGYASTEIIITKNPAWMFDQMEYMDYFLKEMMYSSGQMTPEEKANWDTEKGMWYYEILNRDIVRKLFHIPIKNEDGYFDIDRMSRRPSHFKYDR